jgi:hypothetical protein
MYRPCFCEPIFRVQTKSAINFLSLSTNSCAPCGEANGCMASNNRNSSPINRLVLLIESWAVQSERACSDHHLCQLWSWWSVCSSYSHQCQGFLPQGTPSSSSLSVITNYSGIFGFLFSFQYHHCCRQPTLLFLITGRIPSKKREETWTKKEVTWTKRKEMTWTNLYCR